MPPTGFETAIPTSERPQTHALELAAPRIVEDINLLSGKGNTARITYEECVASKGAVCLPVDAASRDTQTHVLACVGCVRYRSENDQH
jgi:hypothetical protein